MNKLKKSMMLVVLLLFGGIILGVGHYDSLAKGAAGESGKEVDILFAHDTHSHLDSFLTMVDGQTTDVGGFARLMTLIKAQKSENPDTFILDGGDYSMGTLVQSIYATDSAELRMLGALGFDVTTLGNHEFDYRSEGLASSLTAAKDSGDFLPQMVLCNIDWERMEKKGLSEEQQLLKDAFEYYGMQDYIVLEKGGVRMAVFGIFGEDSLACAPTCVLEFEDASKAAKRVIDQIKATEEVDMIVCVSHSGTTPNHKNSEDEELAKNVPEIDLIVSAHTHTVLEKPIVHGNTYIVSCGEYGKHLGQIHMTQLENGRWRMDTYELHPITDAIVSDREIQERIDEFMEIVDKTYLSRFGYTRDEIVATNEVEFCTVKDLEKKHTELNLGSIIADAYLYYVNEVVDPNGDTVVVSVAPSGTIRETYGIGNITVEDVYNSFSLGIGLDGVAGYPLISIYLTGRELKTAAEIDATVSDFMTSARLYCSGLQVTYNPHRMILNKVMRCKILDTNGNEVAIDNDKLYRVVTDLYSGQMLAAVTKVSYGILKIKPKDASGRVYSNIEDAIITKDGEEVKAWVAIVEYMKSFEDTDGDGIGEVPLWYGQPQGRKVVDNSYNLWHLIKNPNKFFFIIIGIVLFALFLAIMIIRLIIKIIRLIIHKVHEIRMLD